MFLFILAILAISVGGGISVFLAINKEDHAALPALIGVVLCAVFLFLSFMRIVPVGHTGVVTTFGRVENYTFDSGVHFVAPWRSVINMDNRVQKHTEQLSCFSADIQEVSMSYTVNYQISKANAMTLYSTIGKQYYDTAIAPNIAESVKTATARHTAEGLIASRAELAEEIEVILAEKLAQYNIELVSTSIEDMDFTDAFTDAVEAKQVAQQNKLKAETEAEQRVVEADAAAQVKRVQAEADADARKIAADAEAYEIGVRAEAEAEANQKIASSLTNALIDYTYAQNWNGELPSVTGTDGVIVNAGSLIGE